MIKKLLSYFGLIKPMPNLEFKKIPTDDKEEIIRILAGYKKQNPAKYEAKKAALFAKYGLNDLPEEEIVEKKDESDLELEAMKEKVVKAKKTKKSE